jgi:hypothetical protein
VQFAFDVGHFGVGDHFGSEKGKVAIGIEEAGTFGLRRDGGPTITGPVGVESKMDAEVGVGMSFGPLRDFRKPRAGDENTGGSDPMVFKSLFDGGIDGMHHAVIIGMNDEQAGIGGIAEALS